MPSANLDLVRSIHEDWARGDFDAADWAHPEIEFVIADGPAPGSWTGLTGLAEGTRQWIGPWEDMRAVAEEFRALDDQRVLLLIRFAGRGKTSGVEVDRLGGRGLMLFHVDAGRVRRLVMYLDREHGLADLGIG